MPISSSLHRILLIAAVVLAPVRLAAEPAWQFNLVGDMYNDGRKLTHPTPEKPAYYFPVVRGLQRLGAQTGRDEPASAKDLVHALATALAHEGYLASREIAVPPGGKAPAAGQATAKALSPPPSLLIVFHWGSINPDTLDAGDPENTNPASVLNQNQMISMTAGKQTSNLGDFGLQTETIMQGIHDDHYFVMVSAYDFKAYNEQHKKVKLWVAKLSVPSSGTKMAEVLPALIKTGAQVFGRETSGPKILDVPIAPEGHVEIGTATVKEDK
jgi:hypothetical protein